MFQPNRKAALAALEEFLPHAGSRYTETRNYDYGPSDRSNVSMLSPWVRTRLLPEWTIVRRVLQTHQPEEASKFIDEVCWRTYWKGWLQQHPGVWSDYLKELKTAHYEFSKNVGLQKALDANTGIDCFDVWTNELLEHGYLHNHARMWYASIWVHTLKLPWVLGAGFFQQHLYDGDAASNTLSWRWVAGLHTVGKTYLARSENIEKYTNGRFQVTEALTDEALDLTNNYTKPVQQKLEERPERDVRGTVGLLLHEDDLAATEWIGEQFPIGSTVGLFPDAAYRRNGISKSVIDFRRASMRSVLPEDARITEDLDGILDWIRRERIETVVMAEPLVGFWRDSWPDLFSSLGESGVSLHQTRHWWDEHFFPRATKGFFKLKNSIPKAVSCLKKKT